MIIAKPTPTWHMTIVDEAFVGSNKLCYIVNTAAGEFNANGDKPLEQGSCTF